MFKVVNLFHNSHKVFLFLQVNLVILCIVLWKIHGISKGTRIKYIDKKFQKKRYLFVQLLQLLIKIQRIDF